MAMTPKDYVNAASPKQPIDTVVNNAKYPNVSSSLGPTGEYEFASFNPKFPNESLLEKGKPDGSNEVNVTFSDSEDGCTFTNENHKRSYVRKGNRNTVDGHNDSKGLSTGRNQVVGDSAKATGGDEKNIGQTQTNIYGGIVGALPGESTNDGYTYYSGTRTERYYKDFFTVVDEDKQETVGGSKQQIVGQEYAVHVQNGNWDTKVDGGEAKFEVQNKITFKVGTSTIVMEPNKITITADRIDLNP